MWSTSTEQQGTITMAAEEQKTRACMTNINKNNEYMKAK